MNHPRIVHLCNVKEVAPSKRLNSKALIYLFYLFLSWFHNRYYMIFRLIFLEFYTNSLSLLDYPYYMIFCLIFLPLSSLASPLCPPFLSLVSLLLLAPPSLFPLSPVFLSLVSLLLMAPPSLLPLSLVLYLVYFYFFILVFP